MVHPLAFFGTPSGGELLLVLLVVLLLFGAKNLPKMARTLGRTMEEFRRAAREVSDEIMQAENDDDPPKSTPRKLPPKTETDALEELDDFPEDNEADAVLSPPTKPAKSDQPPTEEPG